MQNIKNLLIYILKKLVTFLIVALGVVTVSFSIQLFSNVDPAELLVRKQNVFATEEQIEIVREELGLNDPFHERYFNYIGGLFKGDLGISLINDEPVTDNIKEVLPVTVALVSMSMLWVVFFTIVFSVLSVIRKNGVIDNIIRVICIIGICVPSFWLALMLLVAFAIKIPIFNVISDGSFKSLVLPSLALSIPITGISIRVLRATIINELKSDYVTYAKARGFSNLQIIFGEVLRNALPASITLFAQYCAALFGVSALVESVFSIQGLGLYLMEASERMDIYSFSGAVLVAALLFVFFNILADIISGLICPTYRRKSI